MSTERIARGVAARRKSGASLAPSINIVTLQDMAARHSGAAGKVRAAHAKANAELAKTLEQIDAEFDESTIAERKDNGTIIRKDRASIAVLKTAFDQRRSKAHKEAMKETQAALDEARRAAKADLETAKASPLTKAHAWASQHGLADPEVHRYIDRFRMMGPAALRQAAADAKGSGSKNRSAALIAVNDSLKASDRAFSSAELAEAAFAADAQKCATYVHAIERAAADLEVLSRELKGGSRGSIGGAKIKAGLIKDSGSEWGDGDAA